MLAWLSGGSGAEGRHHAPSRSALAPHLPICGGDACDRHVKAKFEFAHWLFLWLRQRDALPLHLFDYRFRIFVAIVRKLSRLTRKGLELLA
jgi:hypothetical protein